MVENATNVSIENCTFACCSIDVWLDHASGVALRNNIFDARGGGALWYDVDNTTVPLTSDYNDFVLSASSCWLAHGSFADADRTVLTLADWRRITGQDAHSFSQDPRFVDRARGDFHVQSTAGSYHHGAWRRDASNGTTIDTGYGNAAAERTPNATPGHLANLGRQDLGAYGGTEQSSHTPTGRLLVLLSPRGASD